MKNICLSIICFLISLCSIGQDNNGQINFEIVNNKTHEKELRISLFKQYETNSYIVGIKHFPKLKLDDLMSIQKQDSDTIIPIKETDFNLLVKNIFGLSVSTLFNSTNKYSLPIEYPCKYSVILEVVISGYNKVVYEIQCPNYNTENRRLDNFETLSKTIFKLANINYNNFFDKNTSIVNQKNQACFKYTSSNLIKYTYGDALGKSPCRLVNITISNLSDTVFVCSAKEKRTYSSKRKNKIINTDSTYRISQSDFINVENAFFELDLYKTIGNMMSGQYILLHPNLQQLSMESIDGKKITLDIANTNDEGTKDFLLLCKELLRLGEFKPNRFF